MKKNAEMKILNIIYIITNSNDIHADAQIIIKTITSPRTFQISYYTVEEILILKKKQIE